jgi:hypothetical protein
LALLLAALVGAAAAAAASGRATHGTLQGTTLPPINFGSFEDVAAVFETLPSLHETDGIDAPLPRAGEVLGKVLANGKLRIDKNLPSPEEVRKDACADVRCRLLAYAFSLSRSAQRALEADVRPPVFRTTTPPAFDPAPIGAPLQNDFMGQMPSMPNFFDHEQPLRLPDTAATSFAVTNPAAWQRFEAEKKKLTAEADVVKRRMAAREREIELVKKYLSEGEAWISGKTSQWNQWLEEQRKIALRPLELEQAKVAKYRKVMERLVKDRMDTARTVNMLNTELRRAFNQFKLAEHKRKLAEADARHNALKAELERSLQSKAEVENAVQQLNEELMRSKPPSESPLGPASPYLTQAAPELPTPEEDHELGQTVASLVNSEAEKGAPVPLHAVAPRI